MIAEVGIVKSKTIKHKGGKGNKQEAGFKSINKTVCLPRSLWTWVDSQPEGRSGFIRRLVKQAKEE